jgi:hypothetical protein
MPKLKRKCIVCNETKEYDKFRADEIWCRSCRVQAEREGRSLTQEAFEESLRELDIKLKPPHL